MGDFGQNALSILAKMADFHGSNLQASKNRKYLSDFSKKGLVGRGIYSTFH